VLLHLGDDKKRMEQRAPWLVGRANGRRRAIAQGRRAPSQRIAPLAGGAGPASTPRREEGGGGGQPQLTRHGRASRRGPICLGREKERERESRAREGEGGGT
jgi:hypothetical protein